MTDRYEPRWDIDSAYGHQGEFFIADLRQSLARSPSTHEVKRQRTADLWLYVETEHDPGRTGDYVPSGLTKSEADWWWFVQGDTDIAVAIPADRLRRAVAVGAGRRLEGGNNGSCPTHGRLIHLAALFHEKCNPK